MPVTPKQPIDDELPTVIAAMLLSTRRWHQPRKSVDANKAMQSQLQTTALTVQVPQKRAGSRATRAVPR